MGTRGLMVVQCDDKLHNFYNGYDSYPDGLGYALINDLHSYLAEDYDAGVGLLKQQARNLIDIRGTVPTEQQIKWCKEFTNLSVSEQSVYDWYCLLRATQGELRLALDARFYENQDEFAEDHLFCEWSYIVDLDKEELRAYNEGYVADKLIATIKFGDIAKLGREPCQDMLNKAAEAWYKETYGDDV